MPFAGKTEENNKILSEKPVAQFRFEPSIYQI
jgi:hypothetical protein